MSAMLARVSEPTSYQAFQHFITHAPWDAEVVWRRLRARDPGAHGHSDPRRNELSPSRARIRSASARQYCGALGKVANCQVAVTAALWTGQRAWPMGALLYLPEAWTTRSGAPRRGADSGDGRLSGEVAARPDAGAPHARGRRDADGRRGRCRIRGQQHGPPDAASVAAAVCAGHLADADGVPRHAHAAHRPHATAAAQSPRGLARSGAVSVRALSDALPAARVAPRRRGATAPIRRGKPTSRPCASRPATDWRRRRLAPEVWLLCERGLGPTGRRKHYFVSLPAIGLAARNSCGWRITAGRSNSTIRTSRPNSGSITSKAARIRAGSTTW